MIRVFFTLIICLSFCNCTSYSPELTESLVLAGENRKELVRVLEHYQKDKDTLKYRAACFLIENMRWHRSLKRVESMDEKIPEIWKKMDHLYTTIVDEMKDARVENVETENRFGYYADAIRELTKLTFIDTIVKIESRVFEDLCEINSDFLIGHIDNAFAVWDSSVYAKHLSFDEFCEYILPYRSVNDTDYYCSGQWLNQNIGKHVLRSTTKNLRNYLKRYNHYVHKMWLLCREIRLNESVGIYDLFFSNLIDCVTLSNNECNILRSCGFPVVVDYMMAYKEYRSRHFYCNFLDSTKVWHRFNPQSTYLDTVSPIVQPSVNFYRNTFAAQKNTPCFLKAKKERVPEEFSSPCIKDVTCEIYETVELTVDFELETSNNLAYLCTFSGDSPQGVIPVTWGIIDSNQKKITFKNALYNVLYFPMFMKGDKLCEFMKPFYLVKDSLSGSCVLCDLCSEDLNNAFGDMLLHRKFPPKSHLLEFINQMRGGRFEGANKQDFSDAKLLFMITETPQPYYQEYVLNNKKAYRYYRYVAPDKYPKSNIAELEFLTKQNGINKYTEQATPLPIFKEEDIFSSDLNQYVQVISTDTMSMRSYKSFDRDILSASTERVDVIELGEPMVVERVRMLPRNSDNMIKPGDRYLLLYWDGGWRKFGIQKAEYNFF